jgi:hypothetical protein
MFTNNQPTNQPTHNTTTTKQTKKAWAWQCDGLDYEINGGQDTIKVRVKSVNYTRNVDTPKGVESIASTSGSSESKQDAPSAAAGLGMLEAPLRKRSLSFSDSADAPPPESVPVMQVIGSISEDGLGLISWW